MDLVDLVHKRKAKYMAQTLEAFERDIEAHIPDPTVAAGFKALVRRRFNELAREAVELLTTDTVPNGVAIEMKDRLSPTGRI